MYFQKMKRNNKNFIKVVLFVVLTISSVINFTNHLVVAQVLPGNDKAVSLRWESTSETEATITWTEPVQNGNSLTGYDVIVYVDPESPILDLTNFQNRTYPLSGLNPGEKYTVKVEPLFSSVSSDDYNFENVFMQKYFTKPMVVEFGVIVGTERITGNDLTEIPVDANVFIRMKDDKDTNFTTSEITVKDNNGNRVTGPTVTAQLDPVDSRQIDLIFNPDDLLNADEKYSVSMNVKDSDSISAVPINFTFKTYKTFAGYVSGDPKENPNEVIRNKNPHGAFIKSKNACFGCHGTQKTLSLDGEIKSIKEAATNFCLTCHDGTAATSVDGGNFQHGFNESGSKMGTTQCSDCHDSHLGWSKTNPNSLKSRLVYNHKKKNGDHINDLQTGTWVGVVDSSSINCYTCHKEKTGKVINLATVDADGNEFYQSDAIVPFNYSKMATNKGKETDLNLCLSCHQSGGKGKNIKDMYLSQESGHKIIFEDRYDELGGGQEGYLTCSDCHETHGSDNIYMLKKELGHEEIDGIYDYDLTEQTNVWSIKKEKEFCLKCHGGTKSTALYGVVAKKYNDTIGTHGEFPLLACSESGCHGSGGSEVEGFIKAAHAPIKKR